MHAFLHHFSLSAPLFVLSLIGYGLSRSVRWAREVGDGLSRFAYEVAMPALLFRLMTGFAAAPRADAHLLLAFFGGCLIVFGLGRLVAHRLFRLDGVAQSVFALGGIFSNNVMLGLAVAKTNLGDAAVPMVSLVIVFNALILWTLVTVSVEWARQGELSLKGFGRTARGVLTNPLIAGILLGTVYGFTGVPLPFFIDQPLYLLGQAALPLALLALGMSLAHYRIGDNLAQSLAITAIKLAIQPLVVYGLAVLLGLPPLETQVVTMLASLAIGVNVFMMAQQFQTMQGPVSSAMVISTLLASLTTPLVLSLTSS